MRYPERVISQRLGQELAHGILGALLAVCRADGDVNSDELDALRRLADGWPDVAVDESLLFSQVAPAALAELIARQAGAASPFRSDGPSDPHALADFFLQTALLVARVDGPLHPAEARAIGAFARALGASAPTLASLEAVLDD